MLELFERLQFFKKISDEITIKKIEIELNYGNLSADQFLKKNPDDSLFFPYYNCNLYIDRYLCR